ncbi:hypothetical protein ScPMuIL_008066 [Solemya velum]
MRNINCRWFLGNLVLLIALNLWIAIYPVGGLVSFLEMRMAEIPIPFRLTLVGMAAANLVASMILETFFIETSFVKTTCQKAIDRCFSRPDYKYVEVENEMRSDPTWPPINQTGQSIYQRLDSQYQLSDTDKKSLGDLDNSSLGTQASSSIRRTMIVDQTTRQIRESPDLQLFSESEDDLVQSDEIMLMGDESTGGYTNPALDITSEDMDRSGHMSTQL